MAFQAYAGLLKALLQHAPNFLVIAIESDLKLLLFASLDVYVAHRRQLIGISLFFENGVDNGLPALPADIA